MLHNFTYHRRFLLPLSSGRTLLDRLCLHPASGCTEEKARELCHQMLVQGLLHPFSESAADPFGGCAVSADFDVRPGRTVRLASTTARLTVTAAPLKRLRSLTSIDVLRVLYIYTNLCGIEEAALQACMVHSNLSCMSFSPLKAFFSLFLYLPP